MLDHRGLAKGGGARAAAEGCICAVGRIAQAGAFLRLHVPLQRGMEVCRHVHQWPMVVVAIENEMLAAVAGYRCLCADRAPVAALLYRTMSDEPPFYSPTARIPERQAESARVNWTLMTKGTHTTRCELRDDQRLGAGVDLQLFSDEYQFMFQRCPTEDGAVFIAKSIGRDYVREGWKEIS